MQHESLYFIFIKEYALNFVNIVANVNEVETHIISLHYIKLYGQMVPCVERIYRGNREKNLAG